MINGQRSHKAVKTVWAVIKYLLLDRRGVNRAASNIDLGPLDPRRSWSAGRSGRVIDPKRFDTPDVSILILHHRPVSEGVGIVTKRLWHWVGRADVSGLRYVGRTNECRVGRDSIIRMELVDFPSKQSNGFRDHVIGRSCGRSCPTIITGQQAKMIGIGVDYYTSQDRAID